MKDKFAIQLADDSPSGCFEYVPIIYGPKTPRKDLHPEMFAKIALVLFKPWRQPSDLRPKDSTWAQALQSFLQSPQALPHIVRFIENMEVSAIRKANHEADLYRRKADEAKDPDHQRHDSDDDDYDMEPEEPADSRLLARQPERAGPLPRL